MRSQPTSDLFSNAAAEGVDAPHRVPLAPGAVLLRGAARADLAALLEGVAQVSAAAPFRHMITPGGFRMTVAMTNCGELGWVSSKSRYRYDRLDPDRALPWPPMPAAFRRLARRAAAEAGFAAFAPDACLVNRYAPGARLSLHQDADERDYTQPIVSVSLGARATFLFGGPQRADKALRVALVEGDVVVWGGPARMRFHGVLPLKAGTPHPILGQDRINLTFRKAG